MLAVRDTFRLRSARALAAESLQWKLRIGIGILTDFCELVALGHRQLGDVV